MPYAARQRELMPLASLDEIRDAASARRSAYRALDLDA